MLREKKIGFIGSGNMAQALISGLVFSNSASPENMMSSDVSDVVLSEIRKKYQVRTSLDNVEVARKSEIIIYATKPQSLGEVLRETAPALDTSKLIISIAAGVPLSAIASGLGEGLRLVRVMPNICAFVKESATAIAAGEHATEDDISLATKIFDSVGKTVFVKEILMDAVTGLSGSGPAFIFTIIDSMADAGVKMGLSRKDSLLLSTQTVLGSAQLLLDSGEHPGQLKDRVASPGGTTISGLHALEQGGLRPTLINAVESATKRSQELGEITAQQFIQNNKNH